MPSHLIDIFDPTEECSVFIYQKLFYRCFQEIMGRGKIPIGGRDRSLSGCGDPGYSLPAVPEIECCVRSCKGRG